MLKYILKRILIFIPTLFVIALATFYLSVHVPGDPVEQMLNANNDVGSSANQKASEEAYIQKRKELGLDLPVFYFAVSNRAMPQNLHDIPKKFHRQNLSALIEKYGNWNEISAYYEQVKAFSYTVSDIVVDSANAEPLIAVRADVQNLFLENDEAVVQHTFEHLKTTVSQNQDLNHSLGAALAKTAQSYQTIKETATPYKKFIPAIHWYGANNQFHRWVTHFMKGDFGISYQDGRPVKTVIWSAVRWTLVLSFISIILTYLIAIPLGIISAAKKGSLTDQTISTSLFILYSLPSFWVATLLILFLGGGDFLDIYPANGVGQLDATMTFMHKLWVRAHHLILPIICFTYGSLAFLSRQMRGAMINTLSQDYIKTARAKGLGEEAVLWKHGFKNSLIPIITLFANVFPLLISGAVILEFKFTIPGMGKTAYEALLARDYPVVYTIVMFSAILTLIGYLVADILYALVDPRIKFDKK
jgi:peptide/nickel transport system permease protein